MVEDNAREILQLQGLDTLRDPLARHRNEHLRQRSVFVIPQKPKVAASKIQPKTKKDVPSKKNQ